MCTHIQTYSKHNVSIKAHHMKSIQEVSSKERVWFLRYKCVWKVIICEMRALCILDTAYNLNCPEFNNKCFPDNLDLCNAAKRILCLDLTLCL